MRKANSVRKIVPAAVAAGLVLTSGLTAYAAETDGTGADGANAAAVEFDEEDDIDEQSDDGKADNGASDGESSGQKSAEKIKEDNKETHEENLDKVDKNNQTANQNNENQNYNKEQGANQETKVPESAPEFGGELPDSGLSDDAYNEGVGDYGDAVDNYNNASSDYNSDVQNANQEVDQNNQQADDEVEEVTGDNEKTHGDNEDKVEDNNDLIDGVEDDDNLKEDPASLLEKPELPKDFDSLSVEKKNEALAAYNEAVGAYKDAVENYNENTLAKYKAAILKYNNGIVKENKDKIDDNNKESDDEKEKGSLEKLNDMIKGYNDAITEKNDDGTAKTDDNGKPIAKEGYDFLDTLDGETYTSLKAQDPKLDENFANMTAAQQQKAIDDYNTALNTYEQLMDTLLEVERADGATGSNAADWNAKLTAKYNEYIAAVNKLNSDAVDDQLEKNNGEADDSDDTTEENPGLIKENQDAIEAITKLNERIDKYNEGKDKQLAGIDKNTIVALEAALKAVPEAPTDKTDLDAVKAYNEKVKAYNTLIEKLTTTGSEEGIASQEDIENYYNELKTAYENYAKLANADTITDELEKTDNHDEDANGKVTTDANEVDKKGTITLNKDSVDAMNALLSKYNVKGSDGTQLLKVDSDNKLTAKAPEFKSQEDLEKMTIAQQQAYVTNYAKAVEAYNNLLKNEGGESNDGFDLTTDMFNAYKAYAEAVAAINGDINSSETGSFTVDKDGEAIKDQDGKDSSTSSNSTIKTAQFDKLKAALDEAKTASEAEGGTWTKEQKDALKAAQDAYNAAVAALDDEQNKLTLDTTKFDTYENALAEVKRYNQAIADYNEAVDNYNNMIDTYYQTLLDNKLIADTQANVVDSVDNETGETIKGNDSLGSDNEANADLNIELIKTITDDTTDNENLTWLKNNTPTLNITDSMSETEKLEEVKRYNEAVKSYNEVVDAYLASLDGDEGYEAKLAKYIAEHKSEIKEANDAVAEDTSDKLDTFDSLVGDTGLNSAKYESAIDGIWNTESNKYNTAAVIAKKQAAQQKLLAAYGNNKTGDEGKQAVKDAYKSLEDTLKIKEAALKTATETVEALKEDDVTTEAYAKAVKAYNDAAEEYEKAASAYNDFVEACDITISSGTADKVAVTNTVKIKTVYYDTDCSRDGSYTTDSAKFYIRYDNTVPQEKAGNTEWAKDYPEPEYFNVGSGSVYNATNVPGGTNALGKPNNIAANKVENYNYNNRHVTDGQTRVVIENSNAIVSSDGSFDFDGIIIEETDASGKTVMYLNDKTSTEGLTEGTYKIISDQEMLAKYFRNVSDVIVNAPKSSSLNNDVANKKTLNSALNATFGNDDTAKQEARALINSVYSSSLSNTQKAAYAAAIAKGEMKVLWYTVKDTFDATGYTNTGDTQHPNYKYEGIHVDGVFYLTRSMTPVSDYSLSEVPETLEKMTYPTLQPIEKLAEEASTTLSDLSELAELSVVKEGKDGDGEDDTTVDLYKKLENLKDFSIKANDLDDGSIKLKPLATMDDVIDNWLDKEEKPADLQTLTRLEKKTADLKELTPLTTITSRYGKGYTEINKNEDSSDSKLEWLDKLPAGSDYIIIPNHSHDGGPDSSDVYIITPVVIDAVTPAAETPAAPAAAVTPAPAAETPAAELSSIAVPATNKLPQTGAAWFEAVGLAAAGLAMSLGSLFGKGKHERR